MSFWLKSVSILRGRFFASLGLFFILLKACLGVMATWADVMSATKGHEAVSQMQGAIAAVSKVFTEVGLAVPADVDGVEEKDLDSGFAAIPDVPVRAFARRVFRAAVAANKVLTAAPASGSALPASPGGQLQLVDSMFFGCFDGDLRRCQPCPPFICPKGKDHCPKSSARRKHVKEWLYNAAWQGCLPCVQHCIEVIGVDAQIESDNKKYTALAWGTWAVDNNVEGAEEVVAYLSSKS